MTTPSELDGGSYLAHYGIRNPWTQWLLRTAPELAGQRPSVLRTTDVRPPCPDITCRQPMNPRSEGWACYHHDPPMRRRLRLDVPGVRWAPNQPSALSLVGKETDVVWRHDPLAPENDGYVIVEIGKR